MTNTKIKEAIKKILPKECNSWYVDQLLALFKEEQDRLLGMLEDESEEHGESWGDGDCCKEEYDHKVRNELRAELRKKLENKI